MPIHTTSLNPSVHPSTAFIQFLNLVVAVIIENETPLFSLTLNDSGLALRYSELFDCIDRLVLNIRDETASMMKLSPDQLLNLEVCTMLNTFCRFLLYTIGSPRTGAGVT